jgi:hypothetical protein
MRAVLAAMSFICFLASSNAAQSTGSSTAAFAPFCAFVVVAPSVQLSRLRWNLVHHPGRCLLRSLPSRLLYASVRRAVDPRHRPRRAITAEAIAA